MKLSVSLPSEDVAFLDHYANERGLRSRSAVLHKAVRLLRAAELGPAYEQAFSEWDVGDGTDWEEAIGDGLSTDAQGSDPL